MKLINKTNLINSDVKKILTIIGRIELTPLQRKKLTVTVKYGWLKGRGSNPSSSGCAYLNSSAMTVRIHSKKKVDLIDFAMVVAHEMAHTRGMTHAQMRAGARYHRLPGTKAIYQPLVEGLKLEFNSSTE